MMINKMPHWMALILNVLYLYIVSSYIRNAKIGFGLPCIVSYIVAGILAIAYGAILITFGKKKNQLVSDDLTKIEWKVCEKSQ